MEKIEVVLSLRQQSDSTLLTIASRHATDLLPALSQAEKRLGREINVTNYSMDEFHKKIAQEDHFVTTVLNGNLEFVKGEQRDLDAITR